MLNYMPIQASAHAAEIDQMTILVHWLMLVLFIGWGCFFLFVLFRFRKSANPTASYAGASGGIVADLTAGTVQTPGGAQRLSTIENVIGSPFDDRIGGSAGANRIVGGAGNDTISGAGGTDVLLGGAGDDAIDGGSGRDTCKQGPGTGPLTACEL